MIKDILSTLKSNRLSESEDFKTLEGLAAPVVEFNGQPIPDNTEMVWAFLIYPGTVITGNLSDAQMEYWDKIREVLNEVNVEADIQEMVNNEYVLIKTRRGALYNFNKISDLVDRLTATFVNGPDGLAAGFCEFGYDIKMWRYFNKKTDLPIVAYGYNTMAEMEREIFKPGKVEQFDVAIYKKNTYKKPAQTNEECTTLFNIDPSEYPDSAPETGKGTYCPDCGHSLTRIGGVHLGNKSGEVSPVDAFIDAFPEFSCPNCKFST